MSALCNNYMEHKMNSKYQRLVSIKQTEQMYLEVSYNAGTEIEKGNPQNTDAIVRCVLKLDPQVNQSPWHIAWEKKFGNIMMPRLSWDGLNLVEIFKKHTFIATANKVYGLSVETGDTLWATEIGNTPICNIIVISNPDRLIVYNDFYGYKNTGNNGNIACLDFQGNILWRVAQHSREGVFSTPHYKNGHLYSNYHCYHCEIDLSNGDILESKFTK